VTTWRISSAMISIGLSVTSTTWNPPSR
jgi:hypothetical protein